MFHKLSNPKILRALDSEGGGGDAAAAESAAPAEEGGAPVEAAEGEPALLAGKYKDATALEEGYNQLRTAYDKKTADIKTDVEKEVRGQIESEYQLVAKGDIPEKSENYKFSPPEGLIPEGYDFSMKTDNPVFRKWQEKAHDMGLTPEQFNEVTAIYVENEMSLLPDPNAELEKLGENGRARVDRVDMWLSKHLDADSYISMSNFSGEASFITAMEQIIRKAGQAGGDTEGVQSDTPLSRPELEAMMKDPRYRDPRHREDAYVKRVTEGFRSLPS